MRGIIPEDDAYMLSSLVTLSNLVAAVTQWIEYLPPKKGVARSIRAGGANQGIHTIRNFSFTGSAS